MESAAIAGIGNTAFTTESAGATGLELALEAILAAAEDAGLDPTELDGIVRYAIDPSAPAEMLGANLGLEQLNFWAETPLGGAGSCMAIMLAEQAVISGQAKAVVCYRSFSEADYGPALRHSPVWLWAREAGLRDFVRPYGFGRIAQSFALQAQRHMHEYGTTQRQLGKVVAVATRHAGSNPNALRPPVTVDEYMATPYVASPLRDLDCFINPSVGACAAIVTTAERARDLAQPPAYIAATAAGSSPRLALNWELAPLQPGKTTRAVGAQVAPRLWERSGLGPDAVDVAQLYDCYSITALTQLEAYGFCGEGEAGPYVEEGRTEVGGALPVNTAGGHLGEAYIHGFNHIVEGVRQVRGTSTAQVPDVEVSLVTGGPSTMTSAMLLTKEPV